MRNRRALSGADSWATVAAQMACWGRDEDHGFPSQTLTRLVHLVHVACAQAWCAHQGDRW